MAPPASAAAARPSPSVAKSNNPEVAQAVSFCAMAAKRSLTDEEILWVVDLRERSRQDKDFASADVLRDAMKKCGVDLWDKEMRWQSKDGRQGVIPAWTTLN